MQVLSVPGRSQLIWQPLDPRPDLAQRSRRRRLKWAMHRWVDRVVILAGMLGIAHFAGVIDVFGERSAATKTNATRRTQASTWIAPSSRQEARAPQVVTRLNQVDGWGRPLTLLRSTAYATFRSAGEDGVTNTADDLILAVAADGSATMTLGPSASTNAEVRTTRRTMSDLGTAVRTSSSTRTAVPLVFDTSKPGMPWLDELDLPMQVSFDDADEVLSELRMHVEDAVGYAENTLPVQLEAELEEFIEPIEQRLAEAPYGAGAAVATIHLMLNVGATHHRMNNIASSIKDDHHNGAWPENSVGTTYVLSSEDGLDAWNRPMMYRRDGIEFVLTSAGPDGVWDSSDDPVLWVYHDASSDFFPNWQAGEYTTGLNAISGQLRL